MYYEENILQVRQISKPIGWKIFIFIGLEMTLKKLHTSILSNENSLKPFQENKFFS